MVAAHYFLDELFSRGPHFSLASPSFMNYQNKGTPRPGLGRGVRSPLGRFTAPLIGEAEDVAEDGAGAAVRAVAAPPVVAAVLPVAPSWLRKKLSR